MAVTNTSTSFKDKWENNPDLAYSETLREGSEIQNWILNRNGFAALTDFRKFLSAKKRVLDAGCGNGRVTALIRQNSDVVSTTVVGIDLVASAVAEKNLQESGNVKFYKRDMLKDDLHDLGKFDFIYCQEVLHHTSNPFQSFKNLVSLLENDGEIAIYVYKQKAPAREFVDDYIRGRIAGMNYEEAMKVCEQVTELGKMLHETKLKLNVPEVKVLDIPAGEFDLQRFVYHFFMKCFWSDNLSFKDNVAINYDWYHPQDCSRHTLEEVLQWYYDCGLSVVHSFVDPYGITVRGTKRAV